VLFVSPAMDQNISRRTVLAAGAALLTQVPSLNAADEKQAKSKLKVAIFSKHLQFLQSEDLAKAAAGLGFDGIDITVRKGGHVEPERVRQDLPGLVEIIRRHGLEVPMITAGIIDAESPHAEDILKTMADLGIRNYRWGDLKFSADQPLAAQLDGFKPRIAKLAALNARYKACAMYHTHSGVGLVGASIWDLYLLLKDFDPNAVGVNYDIGHATIEGGVGGWINSYRITGAHVRGIAVKDFLWSRDSKGAWRPEWMPLGEGMVRLPQFFAIVAASRFSGPLQLHLEYPLTREETFPAMKRDLAKLRSYLAQANL
jgi:sugar phosphate isomerase/epimerase